MNYCFSFVPLTKCDLTLVDVRSIDQSIPTSSPDFHSVNLINFLILNNISIKIDKFNS